MVCAPRTGIFQLNKRNISGYANTTPQGYGCMSFQDQTNAWANLTNAGFNSPAVRQPLKARMDAVIDEADLDEVFETERQLFYVACTRARDRLLITATRSPSDYLADLI